MHDARSDYTTKTSRSPVADTVRRLLALINERGMTVFATIDQRAAAREAGLDLRETVLIIFGSPRAGTPVMDAAPLAALAARHGLSPELVAPLAGIDQLTSTARSQADIVGLPNGVKACLFDMDGVLTETTTVHAAAWKEAFDAFLRRRGEPFKPFDAADYDAYVDGKPRTDGVRGFLAARGINAASGTVDRLADRKNEIFLRLIHEQGVNAYPGSVRLLRAVRAAELRTAVVSSSAHCREVLEAAGLTDLLDVRVDGTTIERDHLAGKPAPDSFLAAARELGVAPAAAAVFEDALAGVAAGRNGNFGYVVGVDRAGQAVALRRHGADVVVSDLADLLARA